LYPNDALKLTVIVPDLVVFDGLQIEGQRLDITIPTSGSGVVTRTGAGVVLIAITDVVICIGFVVMFVGVPLIMMDVVGTGGSIHCSPSVLVFPG
jgi:hypothetical protein